MHNNHRGSMVHPGHSEPGEYVYRLVTIDKYGFEREDIGKVVVEESVTTPQASPKRKIWMEGPFAPENSESQKSGAYLGWAIRR